MVDSLGGCVLDSLDELDSGNAQSYFIWEVEMNLIAPSRTASTHGQRSVGASYPAQCILASQNLQACACKKNMAMCRFAKNPDRGGPVI